MRRIDDHPVLPQAGRRETVTFSFDGRELKALAGEMISSALFANGIQQFSIHPRGDAPQGIFCANGQCAQCTVIVDGYPLKSCVTPVAGGMQIRTLERLPALPEDDAPLSRHRPMDRRCDVLVIGGGPSGMTATVELAKLGFSVILVDDKERLGGKLLLQTHKFFGSIEDCYAGMRGVEIAALLEAEVRAFDNVEVLTGASVVGLFKDRKAGVFVDGRRYALVAFDALLVSPGARERSLVFAGNDLPGVYGAGAFQTLVNRDRVKAADRVFIVGSGNVGLIAAYHALQVGIEVVGIVDLLDRVTGYKVHADKIQRMGVPIYLRHTVIAAEGEGRVQKVTVAEVDDERQPILSTARTYAADTLLIAAGLSPADEFHQLARRYGFLAVKAGDADEIAEASSAMFGGRLAGLKLARLLGKEVAIDPRYRQKGDVLKSHPGRVHQRPEVVLGEAFQAIFHCMQEIPCNPCTAVCKQRAVTLSGELGTIMDLPELTGRCNGCSQCAAVCPGLAITLARKLDRAQAEVVFAHEFLPTFSAGDRIVVTDLEGAILQEAEVTKIARFRKHRTWLVRARVSAENGPKAVGIRVQSEAVTRPLPETSAEFFPHGGIVCRCERVTLGEVLEQIRHYEVKDQNNLKQIRLAMGACGGKTCPTLLPRIFKLAGVDPGETSPLTVRPLSVEVPMRALINEEDGP